MQTRRFAERIKLLRSWPFVSFRLIPGQIGRCRRAVFYVALLCWDRRLSFITPRAVVTWFINYDADVSSSLKQQTIDKAARHVSYNCPLPVIETWCHLWLTRVLFSLLKPDATCDRYLFFSVPYWQLILTCPLRVITRYWQLILTCPSPACYWQLILPCPSPACYWQLILPCPSPACYWQLILHVTYTIVLLFSDSW